MSTKWEPWEETLSSQGFPLVAGIDEAGRGPLAGPVFAAACILPPFWDDPRLDDSKKLSPSVREALFEALTSQEGVIFAIGQASAEEIDQINILQATFLAMQRALLQLQREPQYLLVDGNRLFPTPIPSRAIVQGDGKVRSIAAASILAKVSRDRYMEEADLSWPGYGFCKHKGYPTREHRAILAQKGPCPMHRKSFILG